MRWTDLKNDELDQLVSKTKAWKNKQITCRELNNFIYRLEKRVETNPIPEKLVEKFTL